MLNRLV